MGFHITGRLHRKFAAEQKTERFRKRDFVIELAENPRYPQFVQFQLTGDRCESLDEFQEGDELRIEFSLRGREWTPREGGEPRYFNSLDVWTLERAADGPREEEPPPPEEPPSFADDPPF